MTDVTGIDHIDIATADLDHAEMFYDRVPSTVLGFDKKAFRLNGAPHIHYFNRHFGYVLRPV